MKRIQFQYGLVYDRNHCRDVTTGKIQVLPLQWWAESAPPGCNRVKVSQNLGATSVAPVAPVDTSLQCIGQNVCNLKFKSQIDSISQGSRDGSLLENVFDKTEHNSRPDRQSLLSRVIPISAPIMYFCIMPRRIVAYFVYLGIYLY